MAGLPTFLWEKAMKALTIALSLAILALAGPGRAAETTGAGSTFVYPILAKWAAAYETKTGNKVSYQSVGSGVGITLVKKEAVDFGASDMPLKPMELDRLGMAQFPLVIGGVVPVVHLKGIRPGDMRFTGTLLADIFLGNVRFWNDPAIQKINPTLKLPDMPITVVHRVDGSGTTFNWTNYLSKISAKWKAAVGEGTSVQWPTGLGGKGNEGVAGLVDLTPGSIGYLEYSYALQKKDTIAYGLVENDAGVFVYPSALTFKAAASGVDWDNAKDFNLVMTNAPGEKSYPITATVFVLMYKQSKSPASAAIAMDLFKYALESGQEQTDSLGYVRLPPDLVQKIEDYWKTHFADWKG
jgi:phosphate transport system substrate-binding protein